MTPADYEPDGFKADHSEEVPTSFGTSRVRTSFGWLKVKVAAREQGSRGGFMNNTYKASDTESQLTQDTAGQCSAVGS